MVLLLWIARAWASVVPLSDVRFDVVVSGPLADVEITQTFVNTSEETIEATYLFPLHEGAVVDRMVMTLDDRTIEGRVEELQAAKVAYAEAVAAGRTAALTTAERWNLFRQTVGNIPPGARVEVGLRVIQPVPRVEGVYELVLPLVAGARFVPPGLSDAEALAAPYGESPVRAHVRVEVDGAVEIDDFACVSHRAFEAPTGEGWSVAATDLPMTRDFVVRWTTALDEPQVGALYDGEHLLLVFEPPREHAFEARRPREVVLVVDRSGSMQGPPWQAAVNNLAAALWTLTPEDALRLVLFDQAVEASPSRPATPDWIQAEIGRLQASSPRGGTDLAAGLRAALSAPGDPERQRYVVLVSDGLVADEERVLAEIDAYRGSSRVFTLGVGGAVNRFVLQEIADRGGGTATWVRDGADVEAGSVLVQRLDRPTMSGVEIDWGDWGPYDLAPARVPDVHLGHPVRVLARTRNEEGGPIVVRGHIGREPVEIRVLPREVARGRAIASAWARARVEWLGRRQVIEGVPAVDEGLPLALEYQILSPWTAFLAVDPREREVRTVSVDVPLGQPGDRPALMPESFEDGERDRRAASASASTDADRARQAASASAAAARAAVLAREALENAPSGRSYQQAVQPAPPAADGDAYTVDTLEVQTTSSGVRSTSADLDGVVALARSRGLPSFELDLPWTDRGHVEIGGLGGTAQGLARARASLELAGPLGRDGLGARARVDLTERAVVDGRWRHAPVGVELAGDFDEDSGFHAWGHGSVTDVGAPTTSSFATLRQGWEGGGRAAAGPVRASASGWGHRLRSDPGADVARTGGQGELGVASGGDDGSFELAAGAGASAIAVGEERQGGGWAAGRVSVAADGTGGGFRLDTRAGGRWRGGAARPWATGLAEVALRPGNRVTLALGGGRSIGWHAPELVLPITDEVYLALRERWGGERVRFELSAGLERVIGPFALDARRLDAFSGDAAWRRTGWVGRAAVAVDRRHGAARGGLVATRVTSGAEPLLADPAAPWVPGLLLAHRPLHASLDGRLTPNPGRYATDLVLVASVASPLPDLADRWWGGWQALATAGLQQHLPVRDSELAVSLAVEARQGRPGDPDPGRPDGWLAPDRLGALGVLGTVVWRLD